MSIRTLPNMVAAGLLLSVLSLTTGCMLWVLPPSSPEARAQGLVVFYPGAYNSEWDMQGFYRGFRAAGVSQAIEIIIWADPLECFFVPQGFLERTRVRAIAEAQRITEYQAAHPVAPVTLLGFSSGSAMAVMVAEQLPAGGTVDSLILVGPGLSRYYDLGPALEHTSQHVAVYWSPRDALAEYLTGVFGTVDRVYTEPAATYGFDMEHERLIQFSWEPEMIAYGNYGDHVDYALLDDWIRDYLAPWVAVAENDAD
ncbi:MAG: hypothetical protein ABIG44_10085 [Planctomycetota bacterium]